MSIKQLNAAYHASEDRILFRLNTVDHLEYRFWLTRRVSLFLIAAISQLRSRFLETQHSPKAAKAIEQFEKDAAQGQMTGQEGVAQGYEPGEKFPLGFDPVMVIEASCSLTKNGEKIADINEVDLADIDDALSVDFVLPGGVNLNLKLSPSLINGLCGLLDQLRVQANWGEALLTTVQAQSRDSGLPAAPKNIWVH